MPGLKRFRHDATTLSGIELMPRIRKDQFNLSALGAAMKGSPCARRAGTTSFTLATTASPHVR